MTKLKNKDFEALLREVLPPDGRPVVAYTGLWSILDAFEKPDPKEILAALRAAVGSQRTLLMPTFTPGYQNGFLDLDAAPATTGTLNELFRKSADTRRTASAFFSFAAVGPDADSLAALRPEHAWGDGSVYEYIEKSDAHILTLGLPKTHSSFMHRLEWLERDKIPYRYVKPFQGEVLLNGRRQPLSEKLYVRDLDAKVENSWVPFAPELEKAGMRSRPVGRAWVAAIGARATIAALRPILQRDPFAFVKEPERLRAHFRRVA